HAGWTALQGTNLIRKEDALNVFLPIVEFNATPMMGAQYALMV
ncbi:hypothetical protein PSYMO_36648, partial [Pseudomonas amygdali pv. mori str. 301020]